MRIAKNHRIELLRGVDLFQSCTKTELARIASLTTDYDAKAGTLLTVRGEPGTDFFVIVEGSATATRNCMDIAKLGPGSFFGELALLDRGERTATVVADTDMRLLVVAQREFSSLLDTAPSVAIEIIVELGGRLRRTDEMLDDASPEFAKWLRSWLV